MLDAKRVILVVGPFWWPAAGPAGLDDLPERPRPLCRGGRVDGLTWVVGWHPNGARYRGFPAESYASRVVEAVADIERPDRFAR